MADVQKKKGLSSVQAVSPIVAGIAGIVAGGAAVAAAVVMSDKNNQKKVKEALVGAKEKVSKLVKST